MSEAATQLFDRIRDLSLDEQLALAHAVLLSLDQGDDIAVDDATFRYRTDSTYRTKIDSSIAALQLAQHELREMLPHSQPPQEWADDGDDEVIE